MKIISLIAKKIWRILAIFIILFVILIAALTHGFNVGNIQINGFQVEQLYIKLDKKIILRAKNIQIPQATQKDSSNDDILSITQNIIWLDRIFKEIILDRVKFQNNELSVLFTDNVFHIDTAYLTLSTTFTSKENGLLIDIYNLTFKDFDSSLNGQANADIKHNIYDFNGTFISHELEGKAKFKLKDEMITYSLSDINASSIKNFMDELDGKLKLNKDVKNWIYGYIVADNYFVKNINGKVDIKNENFFLKELSASGISKNLKVKFDDKLTPAVVEEANIELKNETLYFKLKNPKWQGKNLNGSNLEIYKIFDEKKAGLLLNLQVDSMYDKAVNSILKVYNIDVPVEQIAGKTQGKLSIDINFDTLKVTPHGVFKAKDAKVNIAGAPFHAKEAQVELTKDEKLIVNATSGGMDFFNGDIKVVLNLAKQNADISGVIKSFDISADGAQIVKFSDLPIAATLDFSGKDTKLNIKNPNVNLSFATENTIFIADIKDAIAHSPLVQKIGVSGGELMLRTKNFENFDISLKNAEFKAPFVKKDGSNYDKDSFDIKVANGAVSGKSLSKYLNFEFKNGKTTINVKDLNLVLSGDDGDKFDEYIELNSLNSGIFLADLNRTLEFLNYHAKLKKDEMKFDAKPASGSVTISKTKSKFDMFANDISGEFVNSLFGINSFEGGFFKLRLLGESYKNFKGEVRLHGANLKDYTFYNQLLTFLNSVPALIVFKTPDFSGKGFPIKFGKILFEKKGDVIKFLAIEMEGASADIGGLGTINLATKEIDIDLGLKILKDANSIISAIPLVNQIILGKDRTLSTTIKIRGTLDKPKYSTQVLADTLMTPFKLIRNILEAPFLIFE